MTRILGGVFLGVVLGAGATMLIERGDYPGAPRDDAPIQFSSRLGCVETVITEVHPSTDSSGAGSGSIAFRDDIAPYHGAHDEKIMSVTLAYTTETPNMAVGDRARVCLVSVPEKEKSSVVGGCDPDRDPRGRVFLIYDRATQAIAEYSYGVHDCGGA
jgi:hypothetical protein